MKKCLILKIEQEPSMAVQYIPPSRNLRNLFMSFIEETGCSTPRFVWRYKKDLERTMDEEPLIPSDYVCHGISKGNQEDLLFSVVLFNDHLGKIEYLESCYKTPCVSTGNIDLILEKCKSRKDAK